MESTPSTGDLILTLGS